MSLNIIIIMVIFATLKFKWYEIFAYEKSLFMFSFCLVSLMFGENRVHCFGLKILINLNIWNYASVKTTGHIYYRKF